MSQYHCNYCQCPIPNIRIRCAECGDFDLCLQCFSCSAEVGQHRKDHKYHVIDGGFSPLFESDQPWPATDEMTLLDTVEQYGFGNWENVADHIQHSTPQECHDHYFNYYINGNIGKVTFPKESGNRVVDHTGPENGPLSPSITTPLPSIDITLQEQQGLGYMPFRDDFEREYDNDAETLVSGLAVNYDDEDVDIAFKLSQVGMYRERLKERMRRKRIAREYGLISAQPVVTPKQKAQATKKKGSKEDREFKEKMKLFCQFHTSAEHERFFENLKKEKQLKLRIKELMRYRKNGITKLEECESFDEERYHREKKKENKKKMGSSTLPRRTTTVSKSAAEVDLLLGLGKGDNGKIGEESKKDIYAVSGIEMLTEREVKLCNSIGMKPANYITIKTCIIKDYLQRRQGLPVKIRYPSGFDKTHRRKIMNFLSHSGWIGLEHIQQVS